MSAVILPFKGEWQGEPQIERAPATQRMEALALHDARAIVAAKSENDDWTARLLLALLETLSSKQKDLLEFRLLRANLNSRSAVQALAIVQLATGGNAHRELVKSYLNRLEPTEAGQ